MGFISDIEALKYGQQVLSKKKVFELLLSQILMRHLEVCLEGEIPSPLFEELPPAENLDACRALHQLEELNYHELLQKILASKNWREKGERP